MKISINSIKSMNRHYGCAADIAADGSEALAIKVGAQLGAIEEVIDIDSKYQGVVVVKIITCDKHPNADKLSVCAIDDNGVTKFDATPGANRDENGYVQVVCGAPNVRAGLMVAWLPPGSTVPASVGKDPFVLGSRELRGVVSNGMLASAKELAIGDDHDGIMELNGDIQPGTSFAKHFELEGDVVFDIENKMFTHRPDCFGSLGIARELAGIQGLPFTSPAWYAMDVEIPAIEAEPLPLTVRNELPELVPRFCAIVMSDVTIGPSPDWLQVQLAKLGQRPINNIVDLTNFIMLETGQPLHAYDYDKLKALDGGDAATLVVRYPQPGEKIALLNGKQIEPRAEAIMIATENTLIGVGGVMGGADTEVDSTTRTIVIEAANFDMYSIRRTSMAHGLFTDAVSRFNKGQSPLQNRAVIAKIIVDVQRLAGGKVASELIDDNHLPAEAVERGSIHPPVTLTTNFINSRLGLSLGTSEISHLLSNVEFSVNIEADSLTVKAPFWRTDIEIPEDIVEEVGRLYGFDHLPMVLPRRSILPAAKDALLETKAKIRAILSKAGANELLTYSFVHGRLLQNAGQNQEQAFKVGNALSPDLQYYRLSLTPSLLDKVHSNVKAGYSEFALFEIGKAHNKTELDADNLPREVQALSLVFAVDNKAAKQYQASAYYQARAYMTSLLNTFSIPANTLVYERLDGADLYDNPWIIQMAAPFEPARSAVLRDEQGLIWGVVGEFRAAVRKPLKLPDYCAGFEIDPLLFMLHQQQTAYVSLPRFPKVEQDICLKVSTNVMYQKLYDVVNNELKRANPDSTHYILSPIDMYQRPDDTDHKQITLRLSIASYEKTLRDSEVAALLDQVAAAAKTVLSAERV